MPSSLTAYSIYAVPALLFMGWYAHARNRMERSDRSTLEEAQASGMAEPASLHPVIDPVRCIGCRSCTQACPEQDAHAVLGIVRGKAKLVGPANCIGHGACKEACPAGAIELVFGTERRGIDIPQVDAEFQTNVPGIYIAGELGGMGLIRNAVEQGRQAMDSIAALCASTRRGGSDDVLDVVIIGAGPAGFAASLGAKKHGLSFETIEQDSLGGTVSHFPRGKLVMTQPAELPLYGKMRFRETSKEALLAFWQDVEQSTGLTIRYEERVTAIESLPDGTGHTVVTTKGRYRARAVLLAIGRRGTPRTLDVPGEEQSKVTYRLIDPEQYTGQSVLVVGGGDSALEAAGSIAEAGAASVTLSYRSAAFSRAKPANRERIDALSAAGKLEVCLESTVARIGETDVELTTADGGRTLDNDAVIIAAGGILPTQFLKDIGITVDTRHGTA